jgi:hypothetical protein
MLKDADELKTILVHAIVSNHPDLPTSVGNKVFRHCRQFLGNFCAYYTLNCDILLYWALMHDEVDDLKFKRSDGFTAPENDESDYVVWDGPGKADVHYLHGALHLFDAGTQLQKYTRSRTAVPLMDQICAALVRNAFPLFVAEGSTSSKLRKITHHGYLSRAFRSFSEVGGDLFVYRHSLAANDEHILRKIEKGKVESLFVSVYGDPESGDNKRIVSRAELIPSRRSPQRPLNSTWCGERSGCSSSMCIDKTSTAASRLWLVRLFADGKNILRVAVCPKAPTSRQTVKGEAVRL